MDLVATIIRTELDIDDQRKLLTTTGDDGDDVLAPINPELGTEASVTPEMEFQRVIFGSRCPALGISALESSSPELNGLRRKMNKYLSNRLEGTRIILQAHHEVF